jgi:hypothetical protein
VTSEAGARWPIFCLVVVATTSRRDNKVQMIRPLESNLVGLRLVRNFLEIQGVKAKETKKCRHDDDDDLVEFGQYGTHHSYVLVVHTLRVAENEILKLDFPAKRH